MRWLLGKDLLILRRSRLLVALLVFYPVAIALLIGFAISASPSKPSVAIVDETPPGETITLGGTRVGLDEYTKSCSARSRSYTSQRARPPSARSPRAMYSRRS